MQSTSAIRIRLATSDDASALAEFGARTFYEAFAADNTAEDMTKHLASAWGPDLQRAEIADPLLDTLLAVDENGNFGGFAQLQAERAPADVPTQKPVELKRFYVDKPWQGQGLARDLMAAVEQQARERGARELWLGVFQRNARAKAFYSKCGFRKVGTQVFVVGDDPQTDDVMLKEIK